LEGICPTRRGDSQRLELLDWYHLVENLGKVGGSQARLNAVEARLWNGDVEVAVALFDDWQHERVERFIAYLAKHRHRIVNYSYYQAEGISVGSGEIESTVKQIGRRIKISGLSGMRTMCNRCYGSAVLISMAEFSR
jgi:hypothetical protein